MEKDIVQFVEETCGIRLLDYQRDLLREVSKRGPEYTILMTKNHGRYELEYLAYLANVLFGGNNNDSYSI